MDKKMTFYRASKLGSKQLLLPAPTYNLLRSLLFQSDLNCVYVPIRSVQYMAVIDDEEVIFINGHRRSFIEFAWKYFKPQQRKSLSDPVPYEIVFYDQEAAEAMQYIQTEFHKFAQQLYDKTKQTVINSSQKTNTVTSFPGKDNILADE